MMKLQNFPRLELKSNIISNKFNNLIHLYFRVSPLMALRNIKDHLIKK